MVSADSVRSPLLRPSFSWPETENRSLSPMDYHEPCPYRNSGIPALPAESRVMSGQLPDEVHPSSPNTSSRVTRADSPAEAQSSGDETIPAATGSKRRRTMSLPMSPSTAVDRIPQTEDDYDLYYVNNGTKSARGVTEYRCIFRIGENERCTYVGIKQTVVRHIKSVHLGMK